MARMADAVKNLDFMIYSINCCPTNINLPPKNKKRAFLPSKKRFLWETAQRNSPFSYGRFRTYMCGRAILQGHPCALAPQRGLYARAALATAPQRRPKGSLSLLQKVFLNKIFSTFRENRTFLWKILLQCYQSHSNYLEPFY